MSYVDGFVLAVPKDKVEEYRKIAQLAGEVWKEHGALQYVEAIADDVQEGKVTDFFGAVKCKDDEVVGFSWILYESREHRDAVNEKVMKDPRIADMGPESMPFDGQRMIWGGFKPIVEL